MKKLFDRYFCIFFLFFAQLSWAQSYLPLAEYKGKTCHVIEVSQGLTLFSIVQQTGFTGDEILKNNPGCQNELKIGQKLYMPIVRKSVTHKVSDKETLFAIAKRYAVSVDSLISWNINSDKGIQLGQNLRVNNAAIRIELVNQSVAEVKVKNIKDTALYQRNFDFDDTLLIHIVEQDESLYSLSKRFMVSIEDLRSLNKLKSNQVKIGTALKIPINKELDIVLGPKSIPSKIIPQPIVVTTQKKPVIRDPKIAVFLPFAVDSVKYPLNGTSKAAVEFYLGALLGIKELEAIGVRGEVTFYDYLSESTNFPEILSSSEFSDMDLVYAPFHIGPAQLVADFCQANKIKLIFPVNLSSNFQQKNPYAIQLTTSKVNLAINLANDIYELQNGEQVILVRSKIKADSLLEEVFLSTYQALSKVKGKARIIKANSDNFKSFSKNGIKTWYVSFQSEKDKIIPLLTYTSELNHVKVFGLKEWLENKEISSTITNAFNFNYESPTYFNYKSDAVISLHKKYRATYQADISKIACLGYDMFTLIPKILFLDNSIQEGAISRVVFSQGNVNTFTENKASFLLKFVDFESYKYFDEVE
jgi:LysM repeat protein